MTKKIINPVYLAGTREKVLLDFKEYLEEIEEYAGIEIPKEVKEFVKDRLQVEKEFKKAFKE